MLGPYGLTFSLFIIINIWVIELNYFCIHDLALSILRSVTYIPENLKKVSHVSEDTSSETSKITLTKTLQVRHLYFVPKNVRGCISGHFLYWFLYELLSCAFIYNCLLCVFRLNKSI